MKKLKRKPRKRTPEEEAAWKHWAENGEGSPPGFTRIEPPSNGEHKMIVTVRPKREQEQKPQSGEDRQMQEIANLLGITTDDMRRLHELYSTE